MKGQNLMVAKRTARISAASVNALKEDEIIRDTEVRGFGVRRRSGTPSYFLQTRIKGRLRWITIGKHSSPWTAVTARREALRLLGDIADGDDPSIVKRDRRQAVTVQEAAEAFLDIHGAKLKGSTREEYRRLLKNIILPTFGRHSIGDVSRSEVIRLHARLKDTPRNANFALSVLSKLMSWAEIEGLRETGSNPCRMITKYRERKRQRFLSDEEIDRLGRVLKDLADREEESPYVIAAIRLLLLTGARLGEVLSLQWTFIDLQRGLIALPDSKTGQKAIFLNEAALELLRSLPRQPDNPYVLPGTRDGQPIVNLQKPWRRIRELAGIPDVRLHDLRHSFASIAAAQGSSLQVIGSLLGHTNTQTTQRYAHLVATHVREANEAIGAKIGSLMK